MASTNASAKELFVLGRLSMRPTHGHEIMRTLSESRADLWVELSEKHVYYILKKLERDGFVSVEEHREEGRHPRKVYSITAAGLEEFARLMSAAQLIESVPHSDFDVVFGMLAYTDRLTPAQKTAILERRAAFLREAIAETAAASEAASAAGVSGLPARIFDKVSRVAQAELGWLDEVIFDVTHNGWADARPAHPAAPAENPSATHEGASHS